MPIKVYTSGNYIVIDNGTTMSEYAKGYTTYTYVQSTQTFTIKETVGGEYKITRTQILAGDITDEPGTTAFTFNSFVTFLRENTGFKTASGGSGAAPIGATLLKTGQTVSYRSNDDGAIEAGRAVDFTTLSGNNPFGSTARFTDELGGTTYTNNIVIDWSTYDGSTVLGWDRRRNGGGSNVDVQWNAAIDAALAHSVGTFTSGWRLPNRKEIDSLIDSSISSFGNYSPFNIPTENGYYWTSTTNAANTTQAFCVTRNSTAIENVSKTAAFQPRWIPCRTFTVSGTTLT